MNQLQTLADDITRHHAEWTARWHGSGTPPERDLPWLVVEQNHRMNFSLWHAEDEARRDDLGDSHVCEAKRTIDRCNQARNDAIEKLDTWFAGQLPPPRAESPMHSETPGMIVDRLSILALKIYHMRIEAARASAPAEQRRRCAEKCAMMEEQLQDQKNCLRELLAELRAGTRRFKVYRQHKMYNDASLNPALYAKAAPPPA